MIYPPFSDRALIKAGPTGEYPVLVLDRVIDGDTYEAWLLIAPRLAYYATIRLRDLDTPEIRGEQRPLGLAAKRDAETKLREARFVTAKFWGTGKYGRWLCDVYAEGQSLADWLRQAGHVKEKG